MDDFVLIDLRSQYDEVVNYVTNMSRDDILEWMSYYGTVKKIDHKYDEALYSFRSESGKGTTFRFGENNRLIIFHR